MSAASKRRYMIGTYHRLFIYILILIKGNKGMAVFKLAKNPGHINENCMYSCVNFH